MTTIVAAGFISRRTAASQSRVNASYSAKLANLSQESSTPSTTLWSGRDNAPSSWRLYGGSAKTRSTEAGGSLIISATQSPMRIASRGAGPDLSSASRISGGGFGLAGPSTQNLSLGGEAERSGTRDTHQRNHSTHEPDQSSRRVVYARFKVKVRLSRQPFRCVVFVRRKPF